MDKVRELAEKTAGDTHHLTYASAIATAEHTIRAELKPLLKAAQAAIDDYEHHELAAELQHWRPAMSTMERTPDGR